MDNCLNLVSKFFLERKLLNYSDCKDFLAWANEFDKLFSLQFHHIYHNESTLMDEKSYKTHVHQVELILNKLMEVLQVVRKEIKKCEPILILISNVLQEFMRI